jgi:hypothetical protein
MSVMKTFQGGCHCGAVRYEVTLDPDGTPLSCNCSMCGRSGALLQFTPAASFTLLKGEDNLTDYQFNKHVIHHLFCKTCGIKSFARGQGKSGPMVAVNARCLDDADVFALQKKAKEIDGKSA